jgi:hypothetical protein
VDDEQGKSSEPEDGEDEAGSAWLLRRCGCRIASGDGDGDGDEDEDANGAASSASAAAAAALANGEPIASGR